MKDELDDQLVQQARLGSGLRRQLKEACASKQLAAAIPALRRVHRQLEHSEASFPRTARAARCRRWAVEDLQAQSQALEVYLDESSAITSALEALIEQQLGTIEALVRDASAPVRSMRRMGDGPHPFMFGLCLFLAWALLLRAPPIGALFASMYVAVALIAAGGVRLTFDGRSLRVHRDCLWVQVWTSTYDLTRYRDVVLESFEAHDGEGGSSIEYALTLKSPDHAVRLGEWHSLSLAADECADAVREWCAIAARDAA